MKLFRKCSGVRRISPLPSRPLQFVAAGDLDLDSRNIRHRHLPCRSSSRAEIFVGAGDARRRPGLDASLVDIKPPPLEGVGAEGLLGVGVDPILGQLVDSPGRKNVGLEAQLAHQLWELEWVNYHRGQRVVVVPGKLVERLPKSLPLSLGRAEEINDRPSALQPISITSIRERCNSHIKNPLLVQQG